MPNTKKAPNTGRADERAKAFEARERRALNSAARWLRRRGKARENTETKRAYSTAARHILDLAKAS